MINWSLMGPPPDVAGNFMQGVALGQGIVARKRTENALKSYLEHQGDPQYLNALASEDPDLAMRYSRFEGDKAANARAAADAQKKAQADEIEAHRDRIVAGARLIREIKPQDQAGWEQTLGLARQAGIDLSDVPTQFDPQYRDNLVALANTFEPAKEQRAPASVQEYEYAKAQGYQGSYMDFQQETGSPIVQRNDDGTMTVYPRSALRGAQSSAPPPPPPGFVLDDGGPTPGASGGFPG